MNDPPRPSDRGVRCRLSTCQGTVRSELEAILDRPTSRLAELLPTRRDTPEVRTARFAALSRQIPLMYLVLVSNTWTLAFTFLPLASPLHTVGVALPFTLACAYRLFVWWRRRHAAPTAELARRELLRTDVVAGLLAVTFPTWAISLFPYGDGWARVEIGLYLTTSMVTCMFCLIHSSRAALIVGLVAGIPIVAFFVLAGGRAPLMMAVNSTVVSVVVMVIVVVQDRDFSRMVHAQVEASRRERDQSRLLRMIDDMPIAVMTVDPDTFLVGYVNDACRRLFRSLEGFLPIGASDLVGRSIDDLHLAPELDRELVANPELLPRAVRLPLGPELLDVQVAGITGEDGRYLGPMVTWEIVTKEVAAEERIRELAQNDPLTRLPNRTTFSEQLDAALAESLDVAVLFIDLDGFKTVNDMLGHRAGDALLRQVARRLEGASHGAARAVGRLGGDEFAVVLPACAAEPPDGFAQHLVDRLSVPYRLRSVREVRIGASVGIALAPEHGTDSQTLLSRADIALYAAKAVGPGTVRTFDPQMEHRITERVEMQTALRAALAAGDRMFVFYQPIVDASTRRVTTREALIRWHEPSRGWIPPAEFVPVAEQSGMIEELDGFVLARACRTAAGWDDGVRVAVNASAEHLGKGSLVPTVLAALAESGLPADRLEIEVTETALLGQVEVGVAELHELRQAGVRVALDDFGTGYSSLANLRAFPFDKIKIDGSFVRDAVERPDVAAVVRGVAALGRAFGATTVAEGVETWAQFDRAQVEGCTEIQGFVCGRPEPSGDDVVRVSALNGLPSPRRPEPEASQIVG